jgi:hypothetical protein
MVLPSCSKGMQALIRTAASNKQEARALQLVLALQDMTPLSGPVHVDAALRELVERSCASLAVPSPGIEVRVVNRHFLEDLDPSRLCSDEFLVF